MVNTRFDSISKTTFLNSYLQQIIWFLFASICFLILLAAFILFQMLHRPTPAFSSVTASGKAMSLTAYLEPNLRASVILTWGCKAATLAYNFGFSNYQKKIQDVRPYFTTTGWAAYQAGIQSVVSRIVANQLIVQGVVAGTPVIVNQGELPGKGYTWRVQIPFLVTYLSSDRSQTNHYYVTMTIVKVPTASNPQGIGIDTFEMR